MTPKVVIGLGNPGPHYYATRHNIGFRVVDALAEEFGGVFRTSNNAEIATIIVNGRELLLIKPQTFMNSSGEVIPALKKKGITPAEIVVVHDELELPFGSVKTKLGGSHKGHNGLKSIISFIGPDFQRVRCGIGRPEQKEAVPNYVLAKFSENGAAVQHLIVDACNAIVALL